MVMFILQNFVLQLVFSVGAIVLIGLLVAYLNSKFLSLVGGAGYKLYIASGFVGTTIHELGHAVFCVLFGHKIHSIKWFDPQAKNGQLGCVSHSYNKKNLYHLIGNFFIGVGPIILGGVMIFLLMFLLARNVSSSFISELYYISGENVDAFSGETYYLLGEGFVSFLKSMFAPENFISLTFWLFLILSFSIALHMKISPPDIQSGKSGFVFIALLFLLVDVVLAIVHKPLVSVVTGLTYSWGVFIVFFLSLAVLMCLLLVIVALIIRGILSLRKR